MKTLSRRSQIRKVFVLPAGVVKSVIRERLPDLPDGERRVSRDLRLKGYGQGNAEGFIFINELLPVQINRSGFFLKEADAFALIRLQRDCRQDHRVGGQKDHHRHHKCQDLSPFFQECISSEEVLSHFEQSGHASSVPSCIVSRVIVQPFTLCQHSIGFGRKQLKIS